MNYDVSTVAQSMASIAESIRIIACAFCVLTGSFFVANIYRSCRR